MDSYENEKIKLKFQIRLQTFIHRSNINLLQLLVAEPFTFSNKIACL
jgi:hypothetical protein